MDKNQCDPSSSNSSSINTHKSDTNKNEPELKPQPGGTAAEEDTTLTNPVLVSSSTVEVHFATTNTAPKPSASTTSGKPISHKLNDLSLQQIPTEELLGSVTTFYPSGDAECGHALRTSARVIHKMRMDSIRGSTPPPQDRKDVGAGVASGKAGSMGGAGGQAKTPNQQKQVRMVWSNPDKNLFFEALNECGKDFEGIVNYLNTKKRRKDSNSEHAFKVKDVRHLYYQFNQKVSKYLHFSDEVKKEAQELYALINYGEMRKKVPFQNKKYFHKLKDLVYKGATTIREKGRNIRIKTPSCRALRKLNQLEEWQEEIKLPPRVDVILKPATMDAWGRVQTLAQNPRVKTSVTLQKRLSTLLQLLQQKWRHQDTRLVERISNLKAASANITLKASRQKTQHELELCSRMSSNGADGESQKILCFTPSKDAVIHRPMINLAEFLSSYSICLNSYEQRIGAKVRGEVLCSEKLNSFKDRVSANSKRQRHDSGSEKHSPDGKKVKVELKDIREEKLGEVAIAANLAEVFKSPNASYESIDIVKDIEGSDGECHPAGKSYPALAMGDISSDGPDLKSPESNDSLKLSGLSKIKFEPESGLTSTLGDNSNDGALSESDQPKPPKAEECGELSANEDLIKTTVKRKESKEKCSKRKDSKAGVTGLSSLHFRPLISEETIQKIREGWTMQNVGDLTVGDLYIMFGEESKLHLEYAWDMPKEAKKEAVVGEGIDLPDGVDGDGSNKDVSKADGTAEAVNFNGDISRNISSKNEIILSGRLKQLLQIANLNEKTGKRRCPCGHVCDRRIKNVEPITSASTMNDNLLFKQPMVPARSNNVATLANCNILPSPHMRYKQSRWWRMRVNRHQLPSHRVVLPNGSAQYVPVRNNNNNYTGSPKGANGAATPMVSSGQNHQQHPVANSSSSSSNSNGSNVRSSTHKSNDDDHLTKLLDDKINSFSGNGTKASSSSNRKSSIPVGKGKRPPETATVVVTDANDESSCLSLFDISLPSTSSTLIADLMSGASETAEDQLCGGGENSNSTTVSATRILRESPVDGKLLETDINDISLSSFLGHLDAVYESEATSRKRQSDQMNISIISESSVDYIARFEDIAAELRAQQEQDSV